MGFRRFLAIVAAVGVLVLVSRLILGVESIPGGLRLIMVLGLAAIVGLAIADSGPRRRAQSQAVGPRFVVAARPTWPADPKGAIRPRRDAGMPRETRPPRPRKGERAYHPLRSQAVDLRGRLRPSARPRDGGEPRRDDRHRPAPTRSRRDRIAAWRRQGD